MLEYKLSPYPSAIVSRYLKYFPIDVSNIMEKLKLEYQLLIYAYELARIPNNLDEITRRDLRVLILALLITMSHGHTRMSIESTDLLTLFGFNSKNIYDFLSDQKISCLLGRIGDK